MLIHFCQVFQSHWFVLFKSDYDLFAFLIFNVPFSKGSVKSSSTILRNEDGHYQPFFSPFPSRTMRWLQGMIVEFLIGSWQQWLLGTNSRRLSVIFYFESVLTLTLTAAFIVSVDENWILFWEGGMGNVNVPWKWIV